VTLIRIIVLAAALVAATAPPARAQGFMTPFIGYNFGGDSANCVSLRNCDEKRLNIGISFGKTHGILGFEEDIGYARNFFDSTTSGDNAVFTAMSNLLIIAPVGPVQPYGLFGLGLIRPHVHLDPSIALGKNAFGYDLGAGLNLFVSHGVGVRGDVRHFHTLQDVTLFVFSGEKLDFWRASLGATFRF
jgi:opacity protein-like surface antigen